MRRFRSLRQPATLAAVLFALTSPAARAVSIVDVQLDYAFSPNGDGIQDMTAISLQVEDPDSFDYISAGIYADAELPWGEQDTLPALAVLADSLLPVPQAQLSLSLSWDGSDLAGEILPDGLYYLQVLARDSDNGGAQEVSTLDPPRQIILDTRGQSFESLYADPSPFFTPLADSAQTLLKIVFESEDFDPLSDTGTARIYWDDPSEGLQLVKELDLDPGWVEQDGDLKRFRWIWDGASDQGDYNDGLHQAELQLSDDAGNPGDTASLEFDLDALAPGIRVSRLGSGGAGETTFFFQPATLPESLLVRCVDRNGVDPEACRVDWDIGNGWENGGFLEAAGPDTSIFGFPLPVEKYIEQFESEPPVTVHHFKIDARDLPGNSAEALGTLRSITLTLDGSAPPTPQWSTSSGAHIQPLARLEGVCEELAVKVLLYEDGDFVTSTVVDAAFHFETYVTLSPGSHVWTARGQDAAGNLSPVSSALTLVYTPGPGLQMPGRFRGRAGETIHVNSAQDASDVTVRIYSLDGELVRLLVAEGGPREFSVDWDLADDSGRALMDGLYIVNLTTTLLGGERQYARKVVAVVRD